MPLDVLVPDLLLPPEAPAALREMRLPRLERWLAHAVIERVPARGAHGWLAQRHAIPEPPAVAAITLAADTEPRAGAWLRADPVHLRIHDRDVLLEDASVLDVHPAEAEALVVELQALFEEDGLEFEAPHPARWYVRVPPGELPRTTPLQDAIGRNVFGLLPTGEGRINWQSAITEAQMLFSSHAVNAEREASGRPQVNSVWFWGGGETPVVARPYALVHADETFARGLARLAGSTVAPVPGHSEGIDVLGEDAAVLLVLDHLGAPLRRGDAAAWQAAAAALDESWFATLGNVVSRFGSVRLVLPSAAGTRVATLRRPRPWDWLRARKPVNADA